MGKLSVASTVAAMFLAAAAAQAQPGDLYLPPDFDQVRPGLPATAGGTPGGAYCGPTSAGDLLQWLHDNGYPDVIGVEDLGDVAAVTFFIGLLGFIMGTDPDGGTGSQAIVDGIQSQLDVDYPGLFDVGFVGRSSDTASAQRLGHRFDYVVRLLDQGYLALANVGWYVQEPEFEWADGVRCSGHWVALTGYDLAAGDYTARYRDPAGEINLISTKAITDGTINLQDADDVIRSHFASSWNWDRDPNDCTLFLFDRHGIQDNVIYVGGVRLFSRDVPGVFIIGYNLAAGLGTPHPAASGGAPTSLAPHPMLMDVYHCRPGANAIFISNIITGLITTFPAMTPLNQPRRLVFGHDGNLYVAQGNVSPGFSLLAFREDGSLIGSATQSALGAIAYGEQLGRVYWWDPSLGIVRGFAATDTSLQLVGSVPLPPGPQFAAPGYMAVDDGRTADPADDVLYYNHNGSAAIYRLALATQSPLPPLSAPVMSDPSEMVVDNRGHVYVAQGTTSPVLEFDNAAAIVTGSPAAGLQATGLLAMIRAPARPLIENYTGGNTNSDLPLDGPFADCNANGIPDEYDVGEGYSPDANGNGTPDECECPWDLDSDGMVGVVDFLALLAAWGTDPGGPPDFDGDATVGVTDFLALLGNWGACP